MIRPTHGLRGFKFSDIYRVVDHVDPELEKPERQRCSAAVRLD